MKRKARYVTTRFEKESSSVRQHFKESKFVKKLCHRFDYRKKIEYSVIEGPCGTASHGIISVPRRLSQKPAG